jgi:hypothetical protein
MEQHSQVLEVEIEHEGSRYQASYFVENGTIHANVGGRMLTLPHGPNRAADTVKAVLSGYLLQQSRKMRHMADWRHG